MNKSAQKTKLSWHDHNELLFWLTASMADGNAYLMVAKELEELEQFTPERFLELSQAQRLSAYHFVCAVGQLIRTLNRTGPKAPKIQAAAHGIHLREGKDVRDMIEHYDGYHVGKGDKQDSFIRHDAPKPGFAADATSTIVNEDGHWLGGRFNVERALLEIRRISDVAMRLPPPQPPARNP